MTSPGGRAYGPLRRERRWFWATMPSQTLVPLHRGFDWLIFGHFRMGRFSGATSSSMLRATPGWRRIKPARSMVRTI